MVVPVAAPCHAAPVRGNTVWTGWGSPVLLSMVVGVMPACTSLNPEFGIAGDGTEDSAEVGLDGGTEFGDLDGSGEGASADGDGSADDGVPPDACDTGAVCFTEPGGPWSGPVAVTEFGDAGQPSCGGPFADLRFSGFVDVSADPVSCSACQCNTENRMLTHCGDIEVEVHGNTNCSDAATESFTLDPNASCEDLTDNGDPLSGASVVVLPGAAEGTCGASAVAIESKPEVVREGAATLCAGGNDLGPCDGVDGRCIGLPPSGADETICVYAPGDLGCPAGYGDRRVYGTQVEDGRGCTACECKLHDAECGVDATLYYDDSCGVVNPDSIIEIGLCNFLSTNQVGSTSFSAPYLLDGGTCDAEPDGGQAVGDVGFADPVTVCCR